MRVLLIWTTVLVALVFSCGIEAAPVLVSNSTTLKSGNTVGLEVTTASLVYDFDRPLYVTKAVNCAKGFCEQVPPDTSDPCFPGCDFTLKGDRCGTHPNPDCDCSALRESTGWCDGEQDWIPIQLNEWTEVYDIRPLSPQKFRFYLEDPCTALFVEVDSPESDGFITSITTDGPPGVGTDVTYNNWPEQWMSVCPTHPRYRTGTWFMTPQRFWSSSKRAQFIVRTMDVSVPLQLPAPSPPAPCSSPHPDYTCMIPGESTFFMTNPVDPTSGTKFVYTTDRCEQIHLIAQVTQHPPWMAIFFVQYMFDAPVPTPEIFFLTTTPNWFNTHSAPMTICPAREGETVSVYISIGILTLPPGMQAEFQFTLETQNDAWEVVPYVEVPDWMIWGYGRGALEINCGGGLVHLFCLPGTEKFQIGCSLFRSEPSNIHNNNMQNSNAIWLTVDAFALGNIKFSDWAERVPNRFAVNFLLDFENAGSHRDFLPQWEFLLPTCVATFKKSGAVLHDESGEWFAQDVPMHFVQPPCDPEVFAELSAHFVDLQEAAGEYASSNDLEHVQSRRYTVDVVTFADAWVGCQNYVTNLNAEETAERQFLGSETCIVPDASDPCCNENLAWEEACCLPRTVVANITARTVPETALIEGSCDKAECVSSQVVDYSVIQLAVGNTAACSSPALTRSESTADALLIFYNDCKSLYFGPIDNQGLACLEDADCFTGRCDRRSGLCLYDRVQQERLFLQCLVETVPENLKDSLDRFVGWDFSLSVDSLVDHLIQQYTSTACVSPNSHWSTFRDHFLRPPLQGVCPAACTEAGNILCLDQSCPIPLWCTGWSRLRPGSICASSWTLQRAVPSLCGVADAVCNWSPGLSAEDCLANTESFCAVCMGDNDSVCGAPLAGITDESSCEQTVACMLADGSLVTDLTASECEAQFTCSELCPGGVPCTSQQACEQQGGFCEDPSAVLDLMHWNTFVDPAQLQGYCLFEHTPFNNPSCGSENAYNAALDVGCVKYATCVNPVAGCTWINRTPQECAQNGGSWVPAAGLSQAECELGGCTDYALALLTPKEGSQCSNCGGSLRNGRSWKAGRWLGGVVRPTSWLAPAFSSPYSLTPSLDLALLHENMRQVANYEFDALLQTELACSTNPTRAIIDSVACSCLTDSNTNCFSTTTPLIAVGRMCSGSDSLNGVNTLSVSVTQNEATFENSNPCAEFIVSLVNSQLFNPAPTPDVTTGFIPRREEARDRQYQSVFNEEGATVGQVIGNGAEIEYTRGHLNSLYVCVQPSDQIEVLPQYTVAGIGLRTGDSAARPLDVALIIDSSGRFCADVETPKSHATFLPIMVLPDSGSVYYSELSSGELALMWVVASFYLVTSLAVLVGGIVLLVKKVFSLANATSWLYLWFLATAVIRCVYFFLLADQVLDSETTLLDFFLLDFPLIAYLLGNLAIGLSFLFLVVRRRYRSSETLQKAWVFWTTFAVTSLLLILWFVVILILFQYLAVDGEEPDFCQVLLDDTDADQRANNARILRLVYQAVVGFVALVVGLLELVIGISLSRKSAISLLVMALVSSVGVLFDSLAWLIYTAVDDPSPYFAIVLIFTEILPICVLAVILAVNGQSRGGDSSGFGGGSGGSGTATTIASSRMRSTASPSSAETTFA